MTIYILFQKDKLFVFKEQTKQEFDLSRFGGDLAKSETMSKAIFTVLHKLTFENQAKLHFLVDHPFYELKFIQLPYLVKSSSVRPLLIHAVGKNFLTDIDLLNFNFYRQIKDQSSIYAIYATLKEFSEKLSSILYEKGVSLQGIYPLNHWLFWDIRQRHKEAISNVDRKLIMPPDYILLDVSAEFAKFYFVKDGAFTKYMRYIFNEQQSASEKVTQLKNQLKIYNFQESNNPYPLYVTLRDSDLGDEIEKIKDNFSALLKAEQLNFSYLNRLYDTLNKEGQLLSMLRIENAIVKEILRSTNWIKASFMLLGVVAIALLGASIIKLFHYNSQNEKLQSEAKGVIADFDSGLVNLDSGKKALADALKKEKEIWDLRSQFLSRSYTTSNYFRKLQATFDKYQELEIRRVSWSSNVKEIAGIAASDQQLTDLIADLEKLFFQDTLEKESGRLGERIQFSLFINADNNAEN